MTVQAYLAPIQALTRFGRYGYCIGPSVVQTLAEDQCSVPATPQHFLNFLPLPHGHGSFRPTFVCSRL